MRSLSLGFFSLLALLCFGACAEPSDRYWVDALPQLNREGLDPEVSRDIETCLKRVRQAAKEGSSGEEATVEWVHALGALANAYHSYELVSPAREVYRRLLEVDPENYLWPYYLGRLEEQFGAPRAAAENLARCSKLAPAFLPAWIARGEVAMARGELESAAAAFERALALSPTCAPALVGLAKMSLAAGEPAAAAKRLEVALTAQPEASAIHHHLSRAYRSLGEGVLAAEHLRQAGPRQPRVSDALMAVIEERRKGAHNLIQRAQESLARGEFRAAEALYREILRQSPDHPRAWLNLGSVQARLGRRVEAEEALRRAVELAPRDPLASFNLGTVLYGAGRFEAAEKYLRISLEIQPRQIGGRLNLGHVQRRLGRSRQAMEQYRAVLPLAPGNPPAHYWIGILQFRLGAYGEALAEFEAGLEAAPQDVPLTQALARFLATCPLAAVRDGPRALALARKLSQDRPGADVWRTLAMAQAEVGALADAVESQTRAIGLLGQGSEGSVADWESELTLYRQKRPLRAKSLI